MNKTVAVIPARGNSKGVPRKNIKELNGAPLISYTILRALGCDDIDLVVVTTEDKEIAEISIDYAKVIDPTFEKFYLYNRQPKLSQDYVQCDAVCFDVLMDLTLKGIEPEVMLLLQPTSPFRELGELEEGIKLHKELDATIVSGINGEFEDKYLWERVNPYMTPLGHDPLRRRGRQWDEYAFDPHPSLGDIFSEDGAIYVFNGQKFKHETSVRMPPYTPLIRTYDWMSIDINDFEDWDKAEGLAKKYYT